jgi:hypothetical protein
MGRRKKRGRQRRKEKVGKEEMGRRLKEEGRKSRNAGK